MSQNNRDTQSSSPLKEGDFRRAGEEGPGKEPPPVLEEKGKEDSDKRVESQNQTVQRTGDFGEPWQDVGTLQTDAFTKNHTAVEVPCAACRNSSCSLACLFPAVPGLSKRLHLDRPFLTTPRHWESKSVKKAKLSHH